MAKTVAYRILNHGSRLKLVRHLSEMDVDHNPYPECARALTEESCLKLANSYYDMLNHDYRSYHFSTDKMPHNFLCLGLIALLFPQAKILHCNRHPVDTCLSCYFQDFSAGEHRYASDLACLGRYYNQYLRLMGHWRTLFPQLIKDVRYEELISRPRPVLGDILSYCDLPWHEQCLKY
ncbi:MAG: sulfotransferase, partial [bacterium]